MNPKLKEVFKGKVVNKAHTSNTGFDGYSGLFRTPQIRFTTIIYTQEFFL